MLERHRVLFNRSGMVYTDKVTIITGGSKGIGEGCARVFVDAGSRVIICARGVEGGEALARELNKKGPGTCTFVQCDVSKPENIKDLIDKTVKLYGCLDCMINNAGWHPPSRPIDDFSIKEFKDLLQLNLVSVFAGCKYTLPHLRKTRGSIVNVSSLVGTIGQEYAATYVASKGGVSSLTKALAIDEGRNGVRVNAVCPAAVVTPLTDEAREQSDDPENFYDSLSSWHWLGRCAKSEEIGNACLYLASDAASFVTGMEFLISGGAELGYGNKL